MLLSPKKYIYKKFYVLSFTTAPSNKPLTKIMYINCLLMLIVSNVQFFMSINA